MSNERKQSDGSRTSPQGKAGAADDPAVPDAGAAALSLKDKLAALTKLPAARLGDGGKGHGQSRGTGFGGLGDRVRALGDAAPARAADLKARVRAGLDSIKRDPGQAGASLGADLGANLGAKVEALIKPRAADGTDLQQASAQQGVKHEEAPPAPPGAVGKPPSNPFTIDRPPAPEPRSTLIARKSAIAATRSAGHRSSDALKSVATALGSAVERTRTIGRVGYTAVHARVAALARVKQRRAAEQQGPPGAADGKIIRIDADLPKLTPGAPAPSKPRRALWRDKRVLTPPVATLPPLNPSTCRPSAPRARKKCGATSGVVVSPSASAPS